ncbi:pyridoxamine 5'-phosphate oxidase [Alphaproteobacteria bacterium]|nr:pyridoxamine 5'-phosphate oxidase [Alphaproteobacteria bacterium]
MLNEKDPIKLFKKCLEQAKKEEINDPEAMCLATVNKNGQPSNRMVLLKELDDRGFKFHTNSESQKGEEIEHNKKVALCFHWKSLRKQVRVEGRVIEATSDEADAYFQDRPRKRQIGAWASQQSRPLENRETLEQKTKELEQQYEGKDIPRPPYWKGYIIEPTRIEFWFDNPDRLHDRFIFTKNSDSTWSKPQRLYP